MIDYLALGLTHALLMLALLRIMVRPDLDSEDLLADEPETEAPPSPREQRRRRHARKRGGNA